MVIEKINEKDNKRICAWCGAEATAVYCSDDCQKQQAYDNNKNPLSTYGSGIHAKDREELGLDEVNIPNEVSIKIDNQEYGPCIQEDTYYLVSCLNELPTATYSDGTKIYSTKRHKEIRKNGLTVSLNVQNRPKHKFRPPRTDLDYETVEERLAKARKHEQPYIVWNYKTGEKEDEL